MLWGIKNLLLFLFLCFAGYLAAQSDGESPYFVVEGTGEFPLTATDVDVNIAGVIAAVTVTQTYVNAGDGRLEATYVFPASTNAAVHGLTMVVGQPGYRGGGLKPKTVIAARYAFVCHLPLTINIVTIT